MIANKSNKPNLDREDAWMSIVELAVIMFAVFFNPHASIFIFILKLCFQTLKVLRHYHRNSD